MANEDDKYTKPTVPRLQAVPPWYAIARAELGTHEVAGAGDNPRIVEYLKATNLHSKFWHDSTAHCAAFVSWVMRESGLPNPRYASARLYLKYGTPLTAPRLGCITVLWRGDPHSGQGHVGFWVRDQGADMILFGANQDNDVRDKPYPRFRLLGFRLPPKIVTSGGVTPP